MRASLDGGTFEPAVVLRTILRAASPRSDKVRGPAALKSRAGAFLVTVVAWSLFLPCTGQTAGGEVGHKSEVGTIVSGRYRGMFFNPQPEGPESQGVWLLQYHRYKDAVDQELRELVEKTGINLIDFQVLIPWTLADPKQPPQEGDAMDDWANTQTLDNLVSFLDTCGDLGISAEIDLATNQWLPFSIATEAHIANSKWWPEPDETPWTEASVWFTEIIEFVEARVRNRESIALWCPMGNYSLGGAEPVVWTQQPDPRITEFAERFVKECWPKFRIVGSRPKAAPIGLPILADTPSWGKASTAERLSGIINLKKWLVDDLKQPPDIWVLSTYVGSDPAADGVSYLRSIVDILGRENASKILSTDFKAIGCDLSGTIIDHSSRSPTEGLAWNFGKCAEYGFAGWWVWSYRDTPKEPTGIRRVDGSWKEELVAAIRAEADHDNLLHQDR